MLFLLHYWLYIIVWFVNVYAGHSSISWSDRRGQKGNKHFSPFKSSKQGCAYMFFVFLKSDFEERSNSWKTKTAVPVWIVAAVPPFSPQQMYSISPFSISSWLPLDLRNAQRVLAMISLHLSNTQSDWLQQFPAVPKGFKQIYQYSLCWTYACVSPGQHNSGLHSTAHTASVWRWRSILSAPTLPILHKSPNQTASFFLCSI